MLWDDKTVVPPNFYGKSFAASAGTLLIGKDKYPVTLT